MKNLGGNKIFFMGMRRKNGKVIKNMIYIWPLRFISSFI